MSQHDFVLDNATAAALRADLNLALLALASLSSGTSAPASPTTYQLWLDTTTVTAMVLAMYDGVDWITLFTINTTANTVTVAGALANLVEDTTPQAGGTIDMNSKQIRWSKGADVISTAALPVISDGNYFDVTGTVTITTIDDLGGAGTVIKLHFDGACLLTHHATNLILPGAANYTTAAGDELEFTNYATGDWRCTGYALASGGAMVAGSGGGAWTLISTAVASASATLDITGLDSTYDTYAVAFADLVPATNAVKPYFRVGDSGGIDTGAGDYVGVANSLLQTETTGQLIVGNSGDPQLRLHGNNSVGSTAGEGFGGILYINRPGDGSTKPLFTFNVSSLNSSGVGQTTTGGGTRAAVITLDRVQFLFSAGNIASGRMTVWGISHA